MIVEYIGAADVRTIPRADFTQRGLPDPGVTLSWTRGNGYEQEVGPEVGTFLLATPDFRVKNSDVNFGSAVIGKRKLQWMTAADWDKYTMLPVTNQDNTLALTADNGAGVADSDAGGGADRRVYQLENFYAQDVELTLDAVLSGGSQVGLMGRIQERGNDWVGVVAWINIIFGANANLLPGVWHFNKTGSGTPFNTNQTTPSLNGFQQPILSATGNGSVTTVRSRTPHYLNAGTLVNCQFGSPVIGQVAVATVADAFTFTVPSTWNGSSTTGYFYHLFIPSEQAHRFKLRIVGNRWMMKQWLYAEPEPAWTPSGPNGMRVATGTIPASLAGGTAGPTSGVGGAGIIIAHIGPNGVARVSNFEAESLDAAA